MLKRLFFPVLLIFLFEWAIFQWAKASSPYADVYFQLAARYSARVSLLLFSGILCWTGIKGIKRIYQLEENRKRFVSLLFLLALNHLIHFYFLAMNFDVKGLELREFKNLPGAVAYIVLTLSPFFLWNKKELTKSRYQIILVGFGLVAFLFIGTYLKRLNQDLDIPISSYLLVGNLALLSALVAINILRIFAENRNTAQV